MTAVFSLLKKYKAYFMSHIVDFFKVLFYNKLKWQSLRGILPV